jgi:hypothetical protein
MKTSPFLAIALTFMFLFSSILIIGPGSETVSASSTTVTIDCESIDGRIKLSGPTFGNWNATEVTTSQTFNIAQLYSGYTDDYLARAYSSFDTSVLPDSAMIVSASIKYTDTIYGSSLSFYVCDYGATLDAGDWGCGVDNGTFLSTQSIVHGLNYVTVTPSLISLTGRTQIEMALTDESEIPPSNYRGSGFYSQEYTDASKRPVLQITYMVIEDITYIMDDATIHEISGAPQIWSYNNTHDMAMYQFSTWAGVKDMIIPVPAGWIFFSFFPWSNYTLSATQLNITDVRDGSLYQVYFTYEKTDRVQVHVSTFLSSTGEGFAFETFRLQYCDGLTWDNSTAQNIPSADFLVDYGGNYSIGVFDYFGNLITSHPFVGNAAQKYLSIPLDIYSFKVFNQQDDFSRFRIYYNNTGAPLTFFCAPNEPVERFLRPGPYTIVVTQYPGSVAGASEYFNLTISDAEFLMLNGTTLSRVISDVAGVAALQEVITNLVTPDMVFIKENMPTVPTAAVQYVYPGSVVTASVSSNATGTDMNFWTPHPDTAGTTYTIISEDLLISGDFSTKIWINDTAGEPVMYSANLQSPIPLNGQNITVQSSAPISVQRETTYRAVDTFSWTYHTSDKRYEVTLNLNNTMSQTMSGIEWFIGFAENRSIDLGSLSVHDLDNAVYLVAGLNYDVTSSGVRMHFDNLTSGDSRSLTVSCYDANASSGQSIPLLYVSTKEAATYGGSEDYYLAKASWISAYTAEYSGPLNIKLDFTDNQYIDPTSVVIFDTSSSTQLSSDAWFISANVITINQVTAGPGEARSYDIYFILDFTKKDYWNPYDPLIILPGGFPITPILIGWALIIIPGAMAVSYRMHYGRWEKGRTALFITAFSLVGIASLIYGGF